MTKKSEIMPLSNDALKTFKNKLLIRQNNVKKRSKTKDTGVSIITCTNRPRYMTNVFENYINQKYEYKELIIILNDNTMDQKKWIRKAKEISSSIRVFQVDESKSLGHCLNYGIEKANYKIIAKFDDDDYYTHNYLFESLKAFRYADVVGKSTTYVYFEASKTLAIRNPKRENRYVYRVEGPTLLFKKSIFEKIKFTDKSLGEDIQFCRDCIKSGIKIYSTDINNYIYIRHGQTDKHAWNINDELYMKLCKIIGKTEDYKAFINNRNKKPSL